MDLRRRAVVPLSLGLGMLGVVVAAGLSPNTGVVRAASNCTYGQCAATQTFPIWAVASAVAVVLVALLLALLLLRRRRRPGQPPSEWQGPGGPGAPPDSGATTAEEMGTAGAIAGSTAMAPPAWHEGATPDDPYAPAPSETGPPPSGGESMDYADVPVPVAPPSPEPPAPVEAPPPPTTPAAGASDEAEPDIDSLMAELEKISGEILKKSPKKRGGSSSTASTSSSDSDT